MATTKKAVLKGRGFGPHFSGKSLKKEEDKEGVVLERSLHGSILDFLANIQYSAKI